MTTKVRGVALALAAGLLAAGGWTVWSREAGEEKLRVVFHVNFADLERQTGALKNVTNFLREVPDAEVEVVCHAAGIGLVVADMTKESGRVAELIGRKVVFVACENTLRDKLIDRDRLLPGVGTVPSGAVEVVRKQHQGFAYFKP